MPNCACFGLELVTDAKKTRLGIFVIYIQTKDGIFENVQKVIRNFVVKVNLKDKD